jgi:ElaB/YqjD/DUF883 family membrane-anchored ribosome-binding protein
MKPANLEGKVKNGVGRLEEAAGEVLGDPGLQVGGEARQIEGAAEDTLAVAREKLEQTAKKARAVVTAAADQASDTYETLRKRAQGVADTVDPFVKEQPYIALALAVVGGAILGALFAGGDATVIYIKPSRE